MVELKQLLDQHVSQNLRWMTFSGSELRVQRLWLNVRRKLCCEVMLRKRKLERVCLIAVNDMKMPIRDAEMLLLCCWACRWNGSGFLVKSVRESDLQWLKRCNNVFTIARSLSLSISHVDESQHVRPYPSHTCSAVLSEIWVTRFHVLLLVPIETTGSITSANNAVETNWDFVSTDWSPSWAFKELPTFHTFSPSTTCLKGICDTSLCPRRIWIRIVTCVFGS